MAIQRREALNAAEDRTSLEGSNEQELGIKEGARELHWEYKT